MWRFFNPKINELDRCGVGIFCFVIFVSSIFFSVVKWLMCYQNSIKILNKNSAATCKRFPLESATLIKSIKRKIECFHQSEKRCIFYASFIVRDSLLKWFQIYGDKLNGLTQFFFMTIFFFFRTAKWNWHLIDNSWN